MLCPSNVGLGLRRHRLEPRQPLETAAHPPERIAVSPQTGRGRQLTDHPTKVFDTFAGTRMRGEETIDHVRVSLAQGRELLEERNYAARRVPGIRDVADAKLIGLAFRVTRELHERAARHQLRRQAPDAGRCAGPQQRSEQPETHIGNLCPPHLIDAMTGYHVPDFVAQHPGQLALVARHLDEPAMHVNKSVRQGERVDFRAIDDLEDLGQLGPPRHGRQCPAQITTYPLTPPNSCATAGRGAHSNPDDTDRAHACVPEQRSLR